MTEYTLTLVDVRQVQSFVFGANELKQNLGASALVELATHEWVADALKSGNLTYNALDDLSQIKETPSVWRDNALVEILFAGGGNVGLLFARRETAVAFTKQYTLTLMEKAPGLDVAVVHNDFDWNADDLAKKWVGFQENLAERKNRPPLSSPLAGLSVTAQCAYTGKLATGINDRNLVSSEVLCKLNQASTAARRLKGNLNNLDNFAFPENFDDLGGERGRFSYLAVVHADGNGMGQRFSEYLKQSKDNPDFIKRLREFSKIVNEVGIMALREVGDLLKNSAHHDGERTTIYGKESVDEFVELKENWLPFRPIVFGGDDVTFVCDGRLGLALAAKLLSAFKEKILPDGGPIYACAGIAIVHTHYPFAQAYHLAEDLCKDAKKLVRDSEKEGSALNWHFATSGLLGSWREICEREYISLDKNPLNMRPIFMSTENWNTWQNFTSFTHEFRRGKQWANRRNKIKDLREALRAGKEAVKEFTRLYGKLPIPIGVKAQDKVNAMTENGFYDNQCAYFDAVEATDFFIPLE